MLTRTIADVPVFGSSFPPLTDEILKTGVKGYLMKPITVERVRSALAAVGASISRALVVDDEQEARDLLKRIVETIQPDLDVITAQDGDEALEKIQAERPDLVLLDLVMPGVDGMQVLRAMHSADAISRTHVVLVSAKDPRQGPVRSELIALAQNGGLSAHQLLSCARAFRRVLGSVIS